MIDAKQQRGLQIALWDLPRAAALWLACAPIILYRLILSPLLPRACRFHPSCSAYALGSLRTHGVLRGGWLALMRLLRCHPFHPGGVDPIPSPRDARPTFADGGHTRPR